MADILPAIGCINGVSGSNNISATDPAVVTNIAVMYNYYDETLLNTTTGNLTNSSLNKLILNPYGVNPVDGSNCNANGVMEMSNFLNLFYATNAGFFNINQSNLNNPAIILMNQTYTSTNSDSIPFSLYQVLLKAYSTNTGITVNDMDPRIIMLLQKETFVAQSLASIKGTTIALSWDEVINSLIRSGVIIPSGSIINKSYSKVPLSLTLKYHSFVLDLDLDIRFTYIVNIQGYVLPTIPPAQSTYNSAGQTMV